MKITLSNILLTVGVICVLFFSLLYVDGDIGVASKNLESDNGVDYGERLCIALHLIILLII